MEYTKGKIASLFGDCTARNSTHRVMNNWGECLSRSFAMNLLKKNILKQQDNYYKVVLTRPPPFPER